ncbi:MAG: VPLPA-CTERM sorting domain-containing protein [Pseudomonadota bacterium]
MNRFALFTTLCVSTLGSTLAAQASSLSYQAVASLLFTTTDIEGNEVDISGGVTDLFASSSDEIVLFPTTIITGDFDEVDLVNTTDDVVLIDWSVFTDVEVDYFIPEDTLQTEVEFHVTSFAGTNFGFDAFAVTGGTYGCSSADLSDPAIGCDGAADGDDAFAGGSGFFELAAGDSLTFFVETAPVVEISFTEPSTVPLPASGAALLAGLAGLGALARRRKKPE